MSLAGPRATALRGSKRKSPLNTRNTIFSDSTRLVEDTRCLYHRKWPRTSHFTYPQQTCTRSFSTSPNRLGGRQAAHTEPKQQYRDMIFRQRHEKLRDQLQMKDMESRRTRLRDLVRSAEVPDDLGLFAGTLIMPSGANLPSFFMSPWIRTRMEGGRIWKRAKDYLTVLAWKYMLGWRKFKISRRKTAPTAVALHRQVYSAFADGNEEELRKIACDGVRDKLTNQIQARLDNSLYSWDIVRYKGRPAVVSHRASELPLDQEEDGEKSNVRQAVVKIRSVQKLTREETSSSEFNDANVREPEETQREVTEYIVVQKRVLRGKEEPWKFWGTTRETLPSEFDEALSGQEARNALLNS